MISVHRNKPDIKNGWDMGYLMAEPNRILGRACTVLLHD